MNIDSQKTAAEQNLTLALASAESIKSAKQSGGGNGQGELMKSLAKLPLAKSERGSPRGLDHVYLSRYDKTNVVQWIGRSRSGYFHGIGNYMEIVEA